MKLLVICCSIVLCWVSQVFSQGCFLPVDNGNEPHMPVLVDNSTFLFRLVRPHNGEVDLKRGDKITLLCPNPKNTLTTTNTNSTLATCVSDTTIRVINKNVNFGSVLCKKSIRGEAVSTYINCGGGKGYIIKLGFPAGNQFLTLIEVCYDSNNGNTLYSTHELVGKEINYASKSNYRPSFSTSQLGPGVSASVAYKQTYEKANFNKLLGSAKLAEKYINSKSYLARGHLAPDADFLLASWQFATYFYVNAVPQWQAVNNGNWKRVEMMSRQASSSYNETLRVYTGTHKVLQLPNARNVNTDIFMVSGGKLAVPKFVWKILLSEKTQKAIAFISLNNPFADKLQVSDMLCTNVCNRYGWDNVSWTNGTKGFIYCCDARDLLLVVPTGPKIKIRGILVAPEDAMRFEEFEEYEE